MRNLSLSEIDDFREADFNDMPVLFTEYRIDRDTLPPGVFAYDIRASDNSDFATLEPWVLVNFTGTIITRTPIPLNDEGYVEIEEYGLCDDMSFEEWLLLNPAA